MTDPLPRYHVVVGLVLNSAMDFPSPHEVNNEKAVIRGSASFDSLFVEKIANSSFLSGCAGTRHDIDEIRRVVQKLGLADEDNGITLLLIGRHTLIELDYTALSAFLYQPKDDRMWREKEGTTCWKAKGNLTTTSVQRILRHAVISAAHVKPQWTEWPPSGPCDIYYTTGVTNDMYCGICRRTPRVPEEVHSGCWDRVTNIEAEEWEVPLLHRYLIKLELQNGSKPFIAVADGTAGHNLRALGSSSSDCELSCDFVYLIPCGTEDPQVKKRIRDYLNNFQLIARRYQKDPCSFIWKESAENFADFIKKVPRSFHSRLMYPVLKLAPHVSLLQDEETQSSSTTPMLVPVSLPLEQSPGYRPDRSEMSPRYVPQTKLKRLIDIFRLGLELGTVHPLAADPLGGLDCPLELLVHNAGWSAATRLSQQSYEAQ